MPDKVNKANYDHLNNHPPPSHVSTSSPIFIATNYCTYNIYQNGEHAIQISDTSDENATDQPAFSALAGVNECGWVGWKALNGWLLK